MESTFSKTRNTGRFLATTGLENQILVTGTAQYQAAFDDFISWYQSALNGDASKYLTVFDFTVQDYWSMAPSIGQITYSSDSFKKLITTKTGNTGWNRNALQMTTSAQLYTNGELYRSTRTYSLSWLYGFKGQVRVDVLNDYGSTIFTGASSTYGCSANKSRTDGTLQWVPAAQLTPGNTLNIFHAKVG